MKFIPVWAFDNYIPAHLAMGRLKEEGINCWLKDENTVTIDPILTNALGGIKLMVAEVDARRAWELLKEHHRRHKANTPCPYCGSTNIELVTSPRKASNWITAIFGFLFGDYALPAETSYRCFDCGKDFYFEEKNT